MKQTNPGLWLFTWMSNADISQRMKTSALEFCIAWQAHSALSQSHYTWLRPIPGHVSTIKTLHIAHHWWNLVEDTPNGFPRLAAFQASDTNFSLYRSFNYLHSRVLLDLQDEITSLEKELDEIDCEDAAENPRRLMSRDYDIQQPLGEGADRSRRVILREIKAKLIEYGMYMSAITAIILVLIQ
jgi:hypothetical protein